jgi:hypothetical protein
MHHAVVCRVPPSYAFGPFTSSRRRINNTKKNNKSSFERRGVNISKAANVSPTSTPQLLEDASIAGVTVWQPPTEGSNALANVFESASPIEGLGSITGFWFLDVFALMNVVLVFALLVGTTAKDMSSSSSSSKEDE